MDKKNLIISAVALTALGIAIIWFGAPSANQSNISGTAAKGELVAGQIEYDFGTISMANGKANHTYTLKNIGTGPVNISKISTSCMCTTAQIKTLDGKLYGPFGMSHGGHGLTTVADINLAAGEEVELIAEFDPNAHGPDAVGPVNRIIYVQSDASKKSLELSFTANVVK